MNSFLKPAIIILTVLVLVSCGGSQTVVKQDNQALSANQVPAETKDADIPSGKYKDMYCVSNNVFIYLSPDKSGGVSSNDQLMKYDRVRMFEVKDNWAKVVLTSATPDMKRTSGWVSRSALDEWVTAKFFNVRDNVFKAKKEIVLYGSPVVAENKEDNMVKEQAVASIAPNDNYRVLKYVLGSFNIVTSKGIEGWAKNSEIDTTKLVLKGFSYEQQFQNQIPESKLFLYEDNINKNKMRSVNYEIAPEDFLDKNLRNGYSYMVFNSASFNSNGSHYSIRKNNVEKDVSKIVYPNSDFFQKGQNNRTIDGLEYEFEGRIVQNFFGMFAVIDIGIPKDYLKELRQSGYRNDEGPIKAWEKYTNFVESIKNKKYKEIVNIKLYSRDENFNLIKEISLTNTMVFKISLEYLKEDINQLVINQGGNLEIRMGVLKGCGLVDPVYYVMNGRLPINYRGDANFNNNDYVLKPDIYIINISGEELKKAGVNNINEIRDAWNRFKNYYRIQNLNIKEENQQIDNLLINNISSIEVNGRKYNYNSKVDGFDYAYGDLIYNKDVNAYLLLVTYYKTKTNQLYQSYDNIVLMLNKNLHVIGQTASFHSGGDLQNQTRDIIIKFGSKITFIKGVSYEY